MRAKNRVVSSLYDSDDFDQEKRPSKPTSRKTKTKGESPLSTEAARGSSQDQTSHEPARKGKAVKGKNLADEWSSEESPPLPTWQQTTDDNTTDETSKPLAKKGKGKSPRKGKKKPVKVAFSTSAVSMVDVSTISDEAYTPTQDTKGKRKAKVTMTVSDDSSSEDSPQPTLRRSQRERDATAKAKERQASKIEAIIELNSDKELPLKIITSDKGRGIMATEDIRKDEPIVEYAGQLIPGDKGKERENLYALDPDAGSFMFYIRHKEATFWY